MDDQLKTHLFAYLEKLEELSRKGAEFAAEQTPLVLQEYITYSRVTSTMWVATGLLLAVVALLLASMAMNKNNWPDSEVPRGAIYSAISVVMFVTVIPMALIGNVDQCIKSWTAPRVLLIEKLNELRR